MRLMSFMVVCFILVGWLRVTWMTNGIAPLPLDGVGGVLIGALGIKAWQRGREGVNTSPKTETTDTTTIARTP